MTDNPKPHDMGSGVSGKRLGEPGISQKCPRLGFGNIGGFLLVCALGKHPEHVRFIDHVHVRVFFNLSLNSHVPRGVVSNSVASGSAATCRYVPLTWGYMSARANQSETS